MWKTRFEVSTGSSPNLPRRRPLSSSPSIIPRSSSSSSFQPSPTVPRVREDSPSAILRPSPSSSIPNLAILTEEEEETDLPCAAFINNEQPSFTLPKQTSNKHRLVLPTILESHDHEALSDSRSDTDEFNDRQHETYAVKGQDSLAAINTNYTQAVNDNSERKLTSKVDATGFTINELLQSKHQRKLMSVRTEIDENDTAMPTTFKQISAFFENKASPVNPTEQKKIVRAKRLLNVHRNEQEKKVAKGDFVPSMDEPLSISQRPIKRIKKTHRSSCDSPESVARYKIDHRMDSSKEPLGPMKTVSLKSNLAKRWLTCLLVTTILLGYVCFSRITASAHRQPLHSSLHHQNREVIHASHTDLISYYGQIVRQQFFAFIDRIVFFRLEKHEYTHSILYISTSNFELMDDGLVCSVK